jgi:GAF domain-containing protein
MPSSSSTGLPSLLEQTLSDNRRFSNGMSPIPSSLVLSSARPGSASGEPPAFGRRASRQASRSNSPTGSEDSGSGNNTGRHFNHAAANAPNNGEPDFEQLDEQLARSSVWRELHRVVRMCAAQPSCDRMVMTLERQTRYLIGASCVRLFLVQRDGLVHYSRAQPFGLSTGLVGFVRARKEIVNITNPTSDERFNNEIDQVHDRPTPTAIMCVPVEADSQGSAAASGGAAAGGAVAAAAAGGSNSATASPATLASAGPGSGSGAFGHGKDVVAVFQAFKEGGAPGESFSTRDCKVLYRLGEFAGNMLRNSRSVDRAHALYNASLQSHKRSAALLDVAKALASETDLNRVVGIIVSQVPELLDSDRCTLFFVDREKEQLIVTKGASKGRAKNLVSWIFGQSNAPELPFPKGQNELRFSMHNGIAGHVAITGETLNIVDAHQVR